MNDFKLRTIPPPTGSPVSDKALDLSYKAPALIHGARVVLIDHPLVSNHQAQNIEDVKSLDRFNEGVHTGADIVDPSGNIARVHFFLRNKQLYAMGSTKLPGRNLDNLYERTVRPRRVTELRLARPKVSS